MKWLLQWSVLPWSVLLISGLIYQSHANADSNSSDKDVAAGARLYIQCTGCHSPSYHRTGPKHCGLMGRQIGSVSGFEFTQAMQGAQFIWDKDTLDKFLRSPLTAVPGTSMGYKGIASPSERKQLIRFLSTLNANNPLCKR